MRKFSALLGAVAALLCLGACSNQKPQMEKIEPLQTYVGVLENGNDDAVIVKSKDGKESHLFWMREGLTCNIPAGETVEVTYTGDMNVENQVLTATSLRPAHSAV